MVYANSPLILAKQLTEIFTVMLSDRSGMETFAHILEITDGQNRQLLLGNGFSQAFSEQIFNYKNLLDSADFGSRSEKIKKVFHELNTYDFEMVMQTMLHSIYIAQSFSEYPAFIEAINLDAKNLKDSLVATIAKTHPSFPTDVTNLAYESTRVFLSKFSNIFTLNYDLLLYWARNMNKLKPADFNSDDGFRDGGIWCGDETDQNVFFLHGGLHLYDESGIIKKHTYTQVGEKIIDQVRKKLADNSFPIFVAEPNHQKKLDKILHNPYLNYCYKKLKDIDGSLVIFGHSMDDTDAHIFEQVQSSGIENVYVSIFGDESTPRNIKTKANAKSFFHKCNVDFYQAESVSIWK